LAARTMSPLLAIRDAVDDGEPNPEGRILAIVSIVFGTLAVAFVVSRWIIRVKIHKVIGADDWVILAALVSQTSSVRRAYKTNAVADTLC